VAVDDIIATSLDVPLSSQEGKLATSLVRRKLAQESEGCQDWGQVMLYPIIITITITN
jgi:hypothetical protein